MNPIKCRGCFYYNDHMGGYCFMWHHYIQWMKYCGETQKERLGRHLYDRKETAAIREEIRLRKSRFCLVARSRVK